MPTTYCRHIRPSGRRCQSPALRNKPFCYYHESVNARLRTLRPPDDGTSNTIYPISPDEIDQIHREPLLAEYYSHTRGPLELAFPPLEDANSIQLALSMVLTALGQNRLEARRAAGMLYNLQIASSNVRKLPFNESSNVRDIVHDQQGNILAPDEDPEEIKALLDYIDDDDEYDDEADDDEEDYED